MDVSEFDYIIVGAGSAGCVLADRLSASGKHSVLVLEAGGTDSRFWIKVPLGYAFTFFDAAVNWRYSAEPDEGLNGRAAYWPRGKVVGGSGSINAMAYLRGLPHDFDDWERAGATGWNAETVWATYDRLERHCETGADGSRVFRGDGALVVSDLGERMHPFSRRFLEAAEEIGFPLTKDMNGRSPEGFSYYRSNVHRGRRWSSADAFLRPALRRSNVQLVSTVPVDKILILDGRAIGVQYRRGGELATVHARREVIVSAGAVNTPQLLQLSGIGPGELLQSVGIDVVQDLREVGRGLQDHLTISHYFEASEPTLNSRLSGKLGQFRAGLQYLLMRSGPLSVPVNQVGGFVRSSPDEPVPDLQAYCNPASYSIRSDGQPVIDPEPGFLLCGQPCRPTSRGEIRITSSDPTVPPLLQPNSLSTEKDRADAVKALHLIRALALAPTMRRVTVACKGPDVKRMSDDEMLANFREKAVTNYHPTCTCRMGRDAGDSVLDSRLRVHGVEGLRVVDASAFPNITSGNTNAPTMMLALRAADLILEDARAGETGGHSAA